MKETISRTLLALIIIMAAVAPVSAETAAQLLDRASQRIMRSGSITASFTFSGAGARGNGTLRVSGKKFVLQAPGSASWYNGKYLWTYSASSGETTLVAPTASELAETNPLSYVAGGASGYSCSYAKGSGNARKTIVLIPKSRKQGIKSATIEINPSTLVPSKISVKMPDGSVTAVSIRKFVYGKALPASSFEYPKNKYPKTKIIDLR